MCLITAHSRIFFMLNNKTKICLGIQTTDVANSERNIYTKPSISNAIYLIRETVIKGLLHDSILVKKIGPNSPIFVKHLDSTQLRFQFIFIKSNNMAVSYISEMETTMQPFTIISCSSVLGIRWLWVYQRVALAVSFPILVLRKEQIDAILL